MKVAGLFPILVAGQADEGISEPIKTQEWIWKGDPAYYQYRGTKDFGLLIENKKIRYIRLFPAKNLQNYIPNDDRFLDPVRLIDGNWIDLSKRYKVNELTEFFAKLFPRTYVNPRRNKVMEEWKLLTITVFQVLKDEPGVLVFLGNKNSTDGPHFVYLNKLDGLAEGDVRRTPKNGPVGKL